MVNDYKIGDKAKIIACNHGHGFNIGSIVTIEEDFEDGFYICSQNIIHKFDIHYSEMEKIIKPLNTK